MAGEALTGRFMLGTATVMVGPQADLQDLEVANSLGLAKNVTLKTTPKFTELMQGVKNSLVASVQTGNDLEVSGELYEYTSKNLAFCLGLDGSTYTETATSTTLTGQTALLSAVLAVTSATGITAGKWLAIHANALDQIFIRKVVSVATLNVTVSSDFPVIIPIGAKVEVVEMVPGGSKADQPYLSAKIVGQIADGSWITILLGKVRFASGISMAFKTDNFDNIPFKFSVYDLVSTDPNLALFTATNGDVSKAMIFSTPTA